MAEYVKRGNADVGTAAAAGAGAGEVTFLALEGDDVNQDVRPRNGLRPAAVATSAVDGEGLAAAAAVASPPGAVH